MPFIQVCLGSVVCCSEINYVLSSVSHRASYLLATKGSGSNQEHNPEQFIEASDFSIGKKSICVRLKRAVVPGPLHPLNSLSLATQ